MQIHAKVSNRTTVTIDDWQDINALREMAHVAAQVLRSDLWNKASNYNQQRAYALAQWILDRVPENEAPKP